MSTNNFEGFKPLNEEEEKHVVGGQGATAAACASIKQELDLLNAKIQAGQANGADVSDLIRTRDQIKAKYDIACQHGRG